MPPIDLNWYHITADIEQIVTKLKEREHYWPKGSRPYSLCVAIVDSIEAKTLRFAYKTKSIEVKLEGQLNKSSGRLGERSAPFLVIFTVTDTNDERGVYRPYNGFYVPVYSKSNLIPVDSSYERRVLQEIESWLPWWTKTKGLKVKITKPLFDIKEFCDGELQSSKPDFLIETPGEKIIFEVMGSHEPEYVERKKRTVGYMEAIGEVIEFDALAADIAGTWDAKLAEKIKKLSALIFRGNT